MSSERITAKAFHDAGGVDDWRVLYWGVHAYFTTDSFAEGARFVALIAEEAEALEHFPDVDLRPQGVTVRTFTQENGALSEQDIDLARRISRIAADLSLGSDPSQVQAVGIAIAQDAGADMRPFSAPRPRQGVVFAQFGWWDGWEKDRTRTRGLEEGWGLQP